MSGRLPALVLFLVASGSALGAATTAPVTQPASAPSFLVGTIDHPPIGESSGIVASRRHQGVFWTHNDSGDSARLYACNRKGESLGTFLISGAEARDWEDIASFKRGRNAYLLIGDIGDNAQKRRECELYLVQEPVLRGPVKGPASLKAIMKIRFQYEDGPHNCESLGVDAVDGVIYLVSKTAEPTCKVYALPLPGESPRNVVFTAKAVATLNIPTTTAMDISPDGLRAVVLTYGDAYEYTRGVKEKWGDAFSREPRRLAMPARAQGESICYGPDGRSLYLTSEKLPCPLLEVPALPAKSVP